MNNYFTIEVSDERTHFNIYAWIFQAEKELGINTHASVHFIKFDGVFCSWTISPPAEHADLFFATANKFGKAQWANS